MPFPGVSEILATSIPLHLVVFNVLAVLAAVHFLWKKLRGKVPSPIAMIGLSAVLGILLWSI